MGQVHGKQVKLRSEPINRLDRDLFVVATTAPVAVTSNTLTNIAGISVPLRSGSRYQITSIFSSNPSSNNTTWAIALAFTGTASRYLFQGAFSTAFNGQTHVNNNTLGGELAWSYGLTESGLRPHQFAAQILTTSAGTLTLQARRSTGTATIDVSWMLVTETYQ